MNERRVVTLVYSRIENASDPILLQKFSADFEECTENVYQIQNRRSGLRRGGGIVIDFVWIVITKGLQILKCA